MRPLANLRQRLSWKLFLSYLVVAVVGVSVLVAVAEIQSPFVLARDLASLGRLIGDNPTLLAELQAHFQADINNILVVGALVAVLAAIAMSLFTAGRIVRPIDSIMVASQRIARGNYGERVPVLSQDELGALAHSFNRMAETLEQLEQRRIELIGTVAHELRTPLSSIKGIMEGLVDGVLPADPSTFLQIERDVSRLQRLVHDLEELSRAEAGQICLDYRSIPPTELVSAAVARLRPQFEDKGVVLCLDVPSDVPPITVDEHRITQVLLNLVGNALQYTSPGGQVTVQVRQQGQTLCVAVRDTGIGIAAEHLPYLFERFYRVEKSRDRGRGGAGIGLAIVKQLVEGWGGRVGAESDAGHTRFWFSLPQGRPSSSPGPS